MGEDDYDFLFESHNPNELNKEIVTDTRLNSVPPWSDEIYKDMHPGFYSKDLIDTFQRYFNAAIEYLGGNTISAVAAKYNLWDYAIKMTAKDLIERKTMAEILRARIGYVGRMGLDLAKAELQIFAAEIKRYPRITDGFEGIVSACSCGQNPSRAHPSNKETWNLFGIRSWNDLMRYAFGAVNRDYDKHQGLEGLKKYQEIAKVLANKLGRTPTVFDEGMSEIRWTISHGTWIEFGIRIWHDFIVATFGKQKHKPKKHFSGEIGYTRAKEEVMEVFKQLGRIPTCKHPRMWGIHTQIRRGNWKEYGINSWKDFIETTFNTEWKGKKPANYYSGSLGLQNVVNDINAFEKVHGRLPMLKDDNFNGINSAFQRGEWISEGIRSWNDLLKYATGRLNHENNLYNGIEGLNLAKVKLRQFKGKNGRMPRHGDEGVGGIANAANNDYWKEFDINSWESLLLATFGEVNKCGRKKPKRLDPKMRLF